MIDFKAFLNNAKTTLTSPTAFSWYGVVGVMATGVLTFLATRKWERWITHNQFFYIDEVESSINSESDDISEFDPEKAWENRPLKEKVKEAAGTALIFTPPFVAAIGSSWCILHGNHKAMSGIHHLIEANTNLASRLDSCKPFAAGMLASKIVSKEDDEPVCSIPHKLYFCDDDLQHEDYGKPAHFFIERPDGEVIDFVSTPLEVSMAECEFNKLIWSDRVGQFGSLNELLNMYNAKSVSDGDYCGWSKYAGFNNGYSWVGFSHKKVELENDEIGYFIIFDSEPTYDELFEKMIHG